MMGVNSGAIVWPNCGEVDVMELDRPPASPQVTNRS